MTLRRFSQRKSKIVFLLTIVPLVAIGQQKIKSNENQAITRQIDSLKIVIASNNDSVLGFLDSMTITQQADLENQKEQNDKIEQLIESSNNPSFNTKKDLVYPFILSMLSALLFWIVFSVWPERRRRNKIRPKLELDIYHIYMDLFTLFDTVMSINRHSPSSYQYKFKGQNLTKADINLGLQNKCLNETYLYDDKIKAIQLPIGLSLKHTAEKIDRAIDRIFDFSENLSPQEILLLENILKTLQVYSYTSNAALEIGGRTFCGVNPSLAYMTDNLFELYQLFGQLERFVYLNKLRDRNISIQMIQFIFHSKQYSKGIKEGKRLIKKYPNDKVFLHFYIVRSLFKKDKQREAYIELTKLIETKPDLVSNRGFLEELFGDNKVLEILRQKYTAEEINKAKQVLATESQVKEHFEENGRKLKQYFIEKSEANSKKTKKS